MGFEEKLKNIFKENDIEILSYNGEKERIVYKCNKCKQIYTYACARNLFSKITLCKKCYYPFKRWNTERLMEYKLKRLYPMSDLEIIKFKGYRDGGEIRCKKCGKIEAINNFEALFSARKDYFCFNCEKESKDKIYQSVLAGVKEGYLELLEWNGTHDSSNKAKFKCKRCGHIFYKSVKRHFNGKYCPNCFKTYNKFSLNDAKEKLLKLGIEDFEILQFHTTQDKALFKHKECGFAFSKRYEDFCQCGGKCPKCDKKQSSYEKKVEKFLLQNSIIYTYQKRFSDFCQYSYDFEVIINDAKILIEVQGEQHYRPIQIFGSFEKQRERDLKKREYCLINNIPLIEIPYWIIKENKLENFLPKKFNDYLEREQS